jgi:hypothetical protein
VIGAAQIVHARFGQGDFRAGGATHGAVGRAQLLGLGLTGSTRYVACSLDRASKRERDGIRFHRTSLPDDERTVSEGIPVTTVPRTLLDCAGDMPARRLERLINEADVCVSMTAFQSPSFFTAIRGAPGAVHCWRHSAGVARVRRLRRASWKSF